MEKRQTSIKKSQKLCLSLFTFVLVCPVFAENQSAPLTWDDCVSIAQKNNPDLISAKKEVEASRANYKGSYNGYLPSVTFSSRLSNSDSPSAESSRWDASGDASMDLLNLRSNAAIQSAFASYKAARAQLTIQSANVRFNLKQAFANLLLAQYLVTVTEQIRDLRRQNSEMVSLKYQSGAESKGNMLQTKAQFTQADIGAKEAIRSLSVARRELAHQLGEPDNIVQLATGTLGTAMLPAEPDMTTLIEINPKVIAQETTMRVAEANLKAAKSSLWPILSVNYSRFAVGDNYFPDSRHWNASGVVTYPLFGSGLTSTYYAVGSAKRNLEKAEADLFAIKNSVQVELQTNWVNFASSLDQVTLQQEFLKAAKQQNDEALVRYSSGIMTFENWQPIVTNLVNLEQSSLTAQLNAVVSEATWEQSLGKTLEEK